MKWPWTDAPGDHDTLWSSARFDYQPLVAYPSQEPE